MGEAMNETEEFNTLAFEKKLMQLKDTQESIQSLSSWCLKQRHHHKKIVASWLNVLKRVKVEQRLTLFYLANDVIQYSKRKNYDFVESWGLNLQKATPLVRDEKVRPKILRILKIWEQRGVYDDEFLSDLTGLLSSGVMKKADDDPLDFQPQQLVNKIRQCTVLEADTDLRLKHIHESPLPLNDIDALCTGLKDRSNKDDVEKELNEGVQCVERYTQALQREIVAREALLALLTTANQYYNTQRGEVKVVAYAYKNFGSRVRALKRKLDELAPSLPRAAPSPPRRDEDVPSPGPDEDLELPGARDDDPGDMSYNIDRTFSTSMSADGTLYNLGLSSFLASDNPLSLFNDSNDAHSPNKIEVINSRPNEKQDFDINNFLKTLIPNDNNAGSGDRGGAREPTLPGLDLPPAPAPPSFYGALDTSDDPEPYHPEISTQWTNSPWNMPGAPQPVPPVGGIAARASFVDTPESPPPAPPAPPLPPPRVPLVPLAMAPYTHAEDMPTTDVDHRGLLPPPPPPPVLPLLGNMEDVDHRLLPALPPPGAPPPRPALHQVSDVDHRNLISLTHMVRAHAPTDRSTDQDYRSVANPPAGAAGAPGLPTPSDIVESVDMDLSEDEERPSMYSHEGPVRRHANNKVLVGGGNNGTTPRDPPAPPLPNPFDNMPPGLKSFNKHFQPPNVNHRDYDTKEEDSNDSAYEDDLRRPEHPEPEYEPEWRQRPFSPRFPRGWGPRARPPWPRPPRGAPRWPGARPQRFW